jgi:hypothetical protein
VTRSTSISNGHETDLYKIVVSADDIDSAKAESEKIVSRMKTNFQNAYPDAKFIIWEKP